MKVGVIGKDRGKLVLEKLENIKGVDLFGYDKKNPFIINNEPVRYSRIANCDIVIISAPYIKSELNHDIDTGFIVENLNLLRASKFKNVIIIDAFLLPGTMNKLFRGFPELHIGHACIDENKFYISGDRVCKDYLTELFLKKKDIGNLQWFNNYRQTEMIHVIKSMRWWCHDRLNKELVEIENYFMDCAPNPVQYSVIEHNQILSDIFDRQTLSDILKKSGLSDSQIGYVKQGLK